MTVVALNEAFAVPGLAPGATLPWPPSTPEREDERARRLLDFTRYRLPEMDRVGVDVAVLSLAAPGIQGVTEANQAILDARTANDYLADTIERYPSRFQGLAALPLQDPDAAVVELYRAVNDLGLRGVSINGHTQGRYLDHPCYEPVWDALDSLGVALHLRPGAPPQQRWRLLEARPELEGPLWSWGAEAGGHALRLVFGGVFDRHPGSTVILGHMGEFLPFQLARLDSWAGRHERPLIEHPPSTYFGRNIVITTGGVCSSAALTGAVLALGAESIMFAADYPDESMGEATRFLAGAPVSQSDREKISWRNAARVLELSLLPGTRSG